eukprot:6428992-Prymnesium_polylepis.1
MPPQRSGQTRQRRVPVRACLRSSGRRRVGAGVWASWAARALVSYERRHILNCSSPYLARVFFLESPVSAPYMRSLSRHD